MKRVERTVEYWNDLNEIRAYISRKGGPKAALGLVLEIDQQVDLLADPNHPRRKGLVVPDAIELVAHPNYLVILDEDESTVTVLSVVHVKQKFP